MKSIDLNCDMGELKAGQSHNFDAEIMPFISSCNIACGFHSGSPLLIQNTVDLAIAHQVKIGAHPSYNDRLNFGRKSIAVDFKTLKAELKYQIGAVKGITESRGQQLHHVKPHGALYNDLVKNADLARLFIEVVKEIDPRLKIYTLAHTQVCDICKNEGITFVNEGFADRRYEQINALRSRSFSDAVISKKEEVIRQVENFIKDKVQLSNGEIKDINIDSLCLHSDTRGAVSLSRTIHDFLLENNVKIAPIG